MRVLAGKIFALLKALVGHAPMQPGPLSGRPIVSASMRLKTSHGTYVIVGEDGRLQHVQRSTDEDFKSVWEGAPPPTPAAGRMEAAVTQGPLAPSTLLVLPDGLVAFRRDGFYLSADTRFPELHFDREKVGPWELFAITTTDGTVVRQPVGRQAGSPGQWVELQSVPASSWLKNANSIEEFKSHFSSRFCIPNDDCLSPPVTAGENCIKLFISGAKSTYPVIFGINNVMLTSICKERGKYVTLTDRSYGIIFDQSGFFSEYGFLHEAKSSQFIDFKDNMYKLEVDKLGLLPEEDFDAFIFYNGCYYNYYHWWCECIVKLEIFDFCLGYIPQVIIWNGRPNLSEWQISSLKLFGAEIVYKNSKNSELVRLKSVTWIEHYEICYVPGFILRRLRQRILKSISIPKTAGKKLYIKRTNSRTIVNDVELDDMLQEKGFEIIYSDEFSQIEQIEIFSSADVVIAAHGAGLTNMLFMRQGSTVIEMMPSAEVRTFYWLLAEKLQHKYGVSICRSVDGHFESALEVDLEEINRLIDMTESLASNKATVDVARLSVA